MIYQKTLLRIISAVATVALISCTGDFEKINHPGTPSDDEAKGDYFYIGVHFQTLQMNVIQTGPVAYQYNENMCRQPYARYLTTTKSAWNSESFTVFNAPRDWLNSLYNDQMVFIYSPWFELKRILEEEERLEHFTWAWAELLRVAAMHRVTDMYGPIPYSDVKNNTGNIYVSYDTQQEVYAGLFEDLDKAIDVLTEYVLSGAASEASAFKEYDLVYNGDFTKWCKFANSLKLRMALRISFVDPVNAAKYARQAIEHPVGVITSNADNAQITVSTNPLFTIQGPYGDTRACADLMTHLQGYNDPRLAAYFVPAEESGQYAAMRSGIASQSEDWAKNNFSAPNVSASDPLLWMPASEIAFIKAEGKLYHNWDFITESVEELYNEGIRLSFAQWNVSGVDSYIANSTLTPANYSDDSRYPSSPVSDVTIAWDDSATDEQKLERIITQKWIALYPLGNEGWSEKRRTGYPRFLYSPVVNNTDTQLAARGASRVPYGPDEEINNYDNYNDAVSNKGLGGRDDYSVRLWWDVKTNKPGW